MSAMPRRLRFASGGYVYHVLNRAVGRARIFNKSQDYAAFERVLKEAKAWLPMRLLSYCCMPNHWHLVVWPLHDGDLSEWLRWLTVTHTQRWHAHHHTAGTGPLYQGRFKSFPVQEDNHYLSVCRYVERNPLRANLVTQPETWRWGSLWHRTHGTAALLLDDGPISLPKQWLRQVAEAQTESELAAMRRCVTRGSPLGDDEWRQRTAKVLALESTLKPRGRPRLQRPQ
jgi:putative transposase